MGETMVAISNISHTQVQPQDVEDQSVAKDIRVEVNKEQEISGEKDLIQPQKEFSKTHGVRIHGDVPEVYASGVADEGGLEESDLIRLSEDGDGSADGTDSVEDEGAEGGVAKSSIESLLVKTPTASVAELSFDVDLSNIEESKLPSTSDFSKVILDADNYPLDAKVFFTKLLLNCELLEKEGPYYIVYQRTSGGPTAANRHYVIALREVEMSDTKTKIEWYNIPESEARARYPQAMAKDAKAVYTPYNHGSWVYDKSGKTLTYNLDLDFGGSVPGVISNNIGGLLGAYPKHLLKTKFDIDA